MLVNDRLNKYIDFAESHYVGADGSKEYSFDASNIEGSVKMIGEIINATKGKNKSDYEIALKKYAGGKPLFLASKEKKEEYQQKVAEFSEMWLKMKNTPAPIDMNNDKMSGTTKTLLIVGGIIVVTSAVVLAVYLARKSKGKVKRIAKVK